MGAQAGEKAQETGTFHCASCDYEVRVNKGGTIPPCPCGKNEYARRTDEPGNESS